MRRSTRTVAPAVATLALIAVSACDAPSRGAGPAAAPAGASLAKSSTGGSILPVDISGGVNSEAADINGLGFAVGYRADPNGFNQLATLWLPTGAAVTLPSLGQYGARAAAINSTGQVVGTSSSSAASGDLHAFLWTAGVGITDLGTLSGDVGSYSIAADVNNRGWVTGHSGMSLGHAFLWTPDGGMQDLGTLGGVQSEARAMNDNGQVVGFSDNGAGQRHAFLWTPGRGMQDLGTLPGGHMSEATGINNKGQVVGWSFNLTTGEYHAFLWTPKGGMRDLGVPTGMISSFAEDINDNGQIVGWTYSAGGLSQQPVVWSTSGTARVLDVATGSGAVAVAISNGGQLAGYTFVVDGSTGARATIWR